MVLAEFLESRGIWVIFRQGRRVPDGTARMSFCSFDPDGRVAAPALVSLALLALCGCEGSIGDPGDDLGFGDCAVETFFAASCANNGACHAAGGQFPTLIGDDLNQLAGLTSAGSANPLVVPGNPDASWLYIKMAGVQGIGGGAPMPLGSQRASQNDLARVAAWIESGAQRCGDPVISLARYDPNTLDQSTLFSCPDPDAPRSSPARVRRIQRREFTRARSRSLDTGRTKDNPLHVPAEFPYSSYAAGISIDRATADLLGFVMEEATLPWTVKDPRTIRLDGLYRNSEETGCAFEEGLPDSACIESYTRFLLERGALFRAPTPGEQQRLEAFFRAELEREQSLAGDRNTTLATVAEAAFRMSGALFRSEVGELRRGTGPVPLSTDELALAFGRVLSDDPVGSLVEFGRVHFTHPDAEDYALGRFTRVRRAADDGSLAEPQTLASLLDHYYGGQVDRPEDRPEWGNQQASKRPTAVGEYWIADNLRQFFREWLDYEDAVTTFKDQPTATSQFPTSASIYDPNTLAFAHAQNTQNSPESNLVRQLDDTIARIVVENHQDSGANPATLNTFQALLLTNRWHVPSNLAATVDVRCDESSPCPEQVCEGPENCPPEQPLCGTCNLTGNACDPNGSRCPSLRCASVAGYCVPNGGAQTTLVNQVHNITQNIPKDPEHRWVDVPESERLGVLTHPAWLAAHGDSFEDGPSAVYRGKWMRETLFCQSVPPLSSVMVEAQLIPSAEDLSARNRLQQSTITGPDSAVCQSCHQLMNPLGLAFETYNHAGYVRATDRGGAVDGSTLLTNLPDPSLNMSYATPQDMIRAFAESDYVRRCFVRQTFRYFAGRDEVVSDACTLSEMDAALTERGSFVDMLEALITSETFTHRHVEETTFE